MGLYCVSSLCHVLAGAAGAVDGAVVPQGFAWLLAATIPLPLVDLYYYEWGPGFGWPQFSAKRRADYMPLAVLPVIATCLGRAKEKALVHGHQAPLVGVAWCYPFFPAIAIHASTDCRHRKTQAPYLALAPAFARSPADFVMYGLLLHTATTGSPSGYHRSC